MQELIEVSIQAVGWTVLKVFTLGRYRGFARRDELVEGSVGLGAIGFLMYASVRWWL